jgi:hypothetical protein
MGALVSVLAGLVEVAPQQRHERCKEMSVNSGEYVRQLGGTS